MPKIENIKQNTQSNSSVFSEVGKALSALLGTEVHYNRSTEQKKQIASLVPAEHQDTVLKAAEIAGMDHRDVAAMLRQESGGNWKPTLHGDSNRRDVGVGQFNTATTTSSGKVGKSTLQQVETLFENRMGRPFDRMSVSDQILGAGVWLQHLKEQNPGASTNKLFTLYHEGLNSKSKEDNPHTRSIQGYRDSLNK